MVKKTLDPHKIKMKIWKKKIFKQALKENGVNIKISSKPHTQKFFPPPFHNEIPPKNKSWVIL